MIGSYAFACIPGTLCCLKSVTLRRPLAAFSLKKKKEAAEETERKKKKEKETKKKEKKAKEQKKKKAKKNKHTNSAVIKV